MYTMPTNNMRLIETSALTRIFGLHRKPFRIVDILQDQDFGYSNELKSGLKLHPSSIRSITLRLRAFWNLRVRL